MKYLSLSVLIILILSIALSKSEITPQFPDANGVPQPLTVSLTQSSGIVSGSVLPCDTVYYQINTFQTITPFQYLVINFNQTSVGGSAYLWVLNSNISDLQNQLNTNQNVIDTLGLLPGPLNNNYTCVGTCTIEINCAFTNGTYYLGIGAQGSLISYSFEVFTRETNGTEIFDRQAIQVTNTSRPSTPPNDRILNYNFYYIDVPSTPTREYDYLRVQLTLFVQNNLTMRIMYDDLAINKADTGVLTQNGTQNDCVYQFCLNTAVSVNSPASTHPTKNMPIIPCSCTTQQVFLSSNSFELSCSLTVSPCYFKPGRWYISVELPPRVNPSDPLSTSPSVSYALLASVDFPLVTTLTRNVTIKGAVEPESVSHYKLIVPANQVVQGQSHLFVQVSNIRGGTVDIFVHRAVGEDKDVAGGPQSCVPANVTCRTPWACNLVVEKCYFVPGTWYISVNIVYQVQNGNGSYLVDDFNRLPVTYTIRSTWVQDASPTPLLSGVPVTKFIGEALYDFYVVEVPPTIDTWLYIELFSLSNDTEVIVAVLHGSLPGGNCYNRPDFYCLTGDNRNTNYNVGPPTNNVISPKGRQSCAFTIQACELQAGPLYLSVYGQHYGYSQYGDNTYYQSPVTYTIYVNFEVALSLKSSISLVDNVIPGQYQHYYLRSDFVDEGSSLLVEITNIQHGIPKSIEAFVNYNYLAGSCPCYDHLYNCTGNSLPNCNGKIINTNGQVLSDPNTVTTDCHILVPPCAFRSGVWYISVLGINSDNVRFTTPIAYTLTATILSAPLVNPLILSQPQSNIAPQWNLTYSYTHFKLGASPVPLQDLIFKLNYVQSSEYLPQHDNSNDNLEMFISIDSIATAQCFNYHCTANIATQSYCNIVIPNCKWIQGQYFVSVRGNYESTFPGRFTVEAFTNDVLTTELFNGITVTNQVYGGIYQHYFIDVQNFQSRTLDFQVFTNGDQDMVSVYINIDERAGNSPCFRNIQQYTCKTKSWCSIQIQSCQLSQSRYYISVYGEQNQFYNIPVEYTLGAYLQPIATILTSGDPITGYSIVGEFQHYKIIVSQVKLGQFLLFSIDNVKHGSIQAYVNRDQLAGRCPCYSNIGNCIADSLTNNLVTNWCEIRIPTCQFIAATYYYSVFGITNRTPQQLPYLTTIGYTLEATIVDNLVIDNLNVNPGRDTNNTISNQFIGNGRYHHYLITIDQSDFDAGYQVIIEINNVINGGLNVYWNSKVPSDQSSSCQLARICTSGLGSGSTCNWQIPFCLSTPGNYYLTIEGITGRLLASYSILVWFQVPANINSNPNPVIPPVVGTTNSLIEANITHSTINQPYGWTQFISLNDVTISDQGDIIEIYFYNITANSMNQPTSFNVYVFPQKPAGLNQCCTGTPSDFGFCQNAPCLNHLDQTTTLNRNGDSIANYLCDGSNGGTCTVTIWSCEVNSVGLAGPATWWVGIYPVSQPTVNPGLSYSVQYSVRNIRVDASGALASSTDLTPIVNSQTISQTYSVSGFQQWRSFSFTVDVNSNDIRLIVQTIFNSATLSNSAVVYINIGNFASALDCNIYNCPRFNSNGTLENTINSCGTNYRYVNSSCCTKSATYYISVRNTITTSTAVDFAFWISQIIVPTTIDIPSNVGFNTQFNTTSPNIINSNTNNFGVIAENYDHYELSISSSDFNQYNSLNIYINRNGTNNGQLYLYVRKGFEAGTYLPFNNSEAYYNNNPSGCYDFQYYCIANNNGAIYNPCVIQIPHCNLVPGDWYISIYNPNSNYDHSAPALDYLLQVFFDPPITTLTLLQVFTYTSNYYGGSYNHYSFIVTDTDIGYNNLNTLPNYFTNWLRVQIGAVNGSSVNLYLNYDDVAGNPTSNLNTYSCLNAIGSVSGCFGNNACYLDVLPCDNILNPSTYNPISDFKLVSGTYYASVQLSQPATYTIRYEILNEDYQQLTFNVENGVGQRSGTTNYIYTITTQPSVNTTDYWYFIDTSTEVTQPPARGNDYYIISISNNNTNNNINAIVSVEIWNDNCDKWTCSVGGINGNTCVIDAIDLAPCTSIEQLAEIFYIHVIDNNNVGFTFNFYHNQSTIQTLQNTQTITEIIYPYEYQTYFFNATNVGLGETLLVSLSVTCGDVEAWIQYNTVAGPGQLHNKNPVSCSINSCKTVGGSTNGVDFFNGNNAKCSMFLDTCTYEQIGYWITVRGLSQAFSNQINGSSIPIKYQLNILQTPINFGEISPDCSNYVVYNKPAINNPVQFYIDIESGNILSQLRFSLLLPNSIVTNVASSLTVSYNTSASYVGSTSSLPCIANIGSCNINVGNRQCQVLVNSCNFKTGRYYIAINAPRGSQVVVDRWDPYIPMLLTNRVYYSTINGPQTVNDITTSLPFTPNVQYYRVDINPSLSSFFLHLHVFNVSQGTISATVSFGGSCSSPLFTTTVNNINSLNNGTIEIPQPTFCQTNGNLVDTIFITITGQTQSCSLHSIKYYLEVEVSQEWDPFTVNSAICDNVGETEEYDLHSHLYHLVPQNSGLIQSNILNFRISDVSNGDAVQLIVNDGAIPTNCNTNPNCKTRRCSTASCSTSISSQNCQFEYICAYNALQFAVAPLTNNLNKQINYNLNVTRVPVNVTTLTSAQTFTVNDVCPHSHDFYLINTKAVDPKSAFLAVVVLSNSPYQVYVNKRSFGWSNCYDTGSCNQNSGKCEIFGGCNYENTAYYITVSSTGPYSVTATLVENRQNITLNNPRSDTISQFGDRIYSVFVNQSLIKPDSRLVVTIDNINFGNLFAGMRYNGLPGTFRTNFDNSDQFCSSFISITTGQTVSNTGYLIVNPCDLVGGVYYIGVSASEPSGTTSRFCHDIEFTITAELIEYGINPISINVSSALNNQVITFYGIDRYSRATFNKYSYYKFSSVLDVTTAFGQVRLANVTGGQLSLRIKVNHLSTDSFAFFNGSRYGNYPGVMNYATQQQLSGSRPYTEQQILSSTTGFCPGCSDACCQTGQNVNYYYSSNSSCAAYVSECTWNVGTVYIVVEALQQFYQDVPIGYSLFAAEYRDYVQLVPNQFVANQMTNQNWEYQFYKIQQPTVSSLRVRVQVPTGEGVLVTLTDAPCNQNVTYQRQIWCDSSYVSEPFACDIEIPTRVSHPGVGHTNFYVSVYGKNATYAITYYEGRENCHTFQGLGTNQGLQFCAGLVPYSVWRWDNYTNLDNEARCFFEDLYGYFRVQPCWTGTTGECNLTLQRFACYESFHRCDQDGFYVGTCSQACETVVYECVNWFESVNLPHYNCSSSRYINENDGACTGRISDLAMGNPEELEDPYLILYAASSTMSYSILVLILLVISTIYIVL